MEIKFRAWNENPGYMTAGVTLKQISEGFVGLNGNHIMQFTGLKDKHGIEIYAGDIGYIGSSVAPANGEIKCKVVFREGSFALEGINEDRLWYFNELERNHFYFQVKGNIYTNT